MFCCLNRVKVRKNAKIRNQVPHLIQNIVWESDKNTGKHRLHRRVHLSENDPWPISNSLRIDIKFNKDALFHRKKSLNPMENGIWGGLKNTKNEEVSLQTGKYTM